MTLQEDPRDKNIAESEHRSLIDQERVEKRTEKLAEEEEHHDKLTGILKGGGEGIRIWQQFMCTIEQENMAKIKQSPIISASTQV